MFQIYYYCSIDYSNSINCSPLLLNNKTFRTNYWLRYLLTSTLFDWEQPTYWLIMLLLVFRYMIAIFFSLGILPGNIQLINYYRYENAEQDEDQSIEVQLFHFWMDFFMEAIKDEDTSCVRFPVCIWLSVNIISASHLICASHWKLWLCRKIYLRCNPITEFCSHNRNIMASLLVCNYHQWNSSKLYCIFPAYFKSAAISSCVYRFFGV